MTHRTPAPAKHLPVERRVNDQQKREGEKVCAKCNTSKLASAFHKNGRGNRGPTCNACRNAHRRASREGALRRASETVDDRLTRRLWETYRLTRAQYEGLITAQQGRCAICGRAPESGKRLAVDHCHKAGHVRALLCTYCNVVVGAYENHAEAAAAYLSKYGDGSPYLLSH